MLTLLGVLFGGIFIGIPVAYAVAVSGMAYLIFESAVPLLVVAQRMVVGVDSFTLLAIPLFVLAGALMAEGDITPRLMKFASNMVGHIPGGLAMVMVVSCMLFGAISGSGVANVVAIGSILLPTMKEQGYEPPFSAALLGCGGSLGTVIPPSITLVIIGVSMGASIGKLFVGGFIPGVITGLGLMTVSYFAAIKRNYPRLERASWREKWTSFRRAFFPLLTPVIIIGGILGGVFTATEAGAVASLYALILSKYVYKKLSWGRFFAICLDTARTSAVVLFLIGSASLFGWILSAENIPQKVASAMFSLSTNYWVLLILFNFLLLVLGMFMETIAIVLIIIPIFGPVMQQMGMDPIHLGVMVCLNLAIGANTPPLGVDLMAACKLADIPYSSSFRPLMPLLGAMILALALVAVFPGLVTFLPNLVMG
ncbi:MAG: TRAP transporter large permease [Aminivibrio sp.]|jgi:C4-dicarboxylate transporter DctM subunit|nr:TRAP transporter large permease [Synergistaceae bacterium]